MFRQRPNYVAKLGNLRRKVNMRWTRERLTWDNILEMVEDSEFEGKESRSDEE